MVVDGGTSMRRALVGDMIAENAVANGWEGVVIYGCISDVDVIMSLELGVQTINTGSMKTTSGKIAVITNSRRATYGYDQRIEAFGEKGMLQVANQLENSVSFLGKKGLVVAKPQLFFLECYADAYRIELTHFVESIQNNTIPLTTADDGLKALALADAALQSYQTGKTVEL